MRRTRVYVEITNTCNMHCSFCHGHSRTPGRMGAEDFRHVLQQLKGKTEYIYYHLMGEPLAHPELPAFLQMAKEAGFRSVITTNGTLLKNRGQVLIDAGVHKVSVSLHSFEGADAQSHRAYLANVADFADAATKKGILVSLRLWNKGCDGGNNETAEGFLRQRFPEAWQENTRGYRVRDKLYLEWGDRFRWPDKDDPEQGEKVVCYGMRDHFGILCDGTVVPCCLDSDGVINLGNVFHQELDEILESLRARAIAEGFQNGKATESLCRRCTYANRFSAR